MTNKEPSTFDSLPLSVRLDIDRICLDFEKAWKQGQAPRIEDYLDQVTGTAAPVLLTELIAQDIDLLLADSRLVTRDDYYARFPSSTQEVDVAFDMIHMRDDMRLLDDTTQPHDGAPVDAVEAEGNRLPEQGSKRQQEFAELIARLMQNAQQGEAFPLERLAREHPQHAEGLRLLHPSMQLLAEASGGEVQPAAAAVGMLGDYQLIREIGRGGMGVVYEARQISLDKRVAVKVLPFASVLDSRRLQRFQNEARAAAQLQHEHIVPVHAVGCDRGVHYYAMQYIDGNNLAEVIQSLRHLSDSGSAKKRSTAHAAQDETATFVPGSSSLPAELRPNATDKDTSEQVMAQLSTKRSTSSPEYFAALAGLGAQAARALQHAHDMGIVHRDIKPSNILLDVNGKLWIADFGLAQVQDATDVTLTGDVIGTLRYMSPEQALAKRVVVDHRTDIYSLGVTLYELVTTRRAFDGHTRAEVLKKISFGSPCPLRKINRRIPVELETIILKALAKNPDERYQTARELAEDLKLFREHRPIRAKPPKIHQRIEKWMRRNPAYVRTTAVAMLLVLVVSVMTAMTSWGELVAERDRRSRVQRLLRQSEGARLTAHSRLELEHDPGLALLLAIEGAQRDRSRAATNALVSALDELHEQHTLVGHNVSVGQGRYSHDGRFVVTTAEHPIGMQGNYPARVWDAETGLLLRELNDGSWITSAVISPDNVRILTSTNPYPAADERHLGDDERVNRPPCIWDAVTGRKLLTLNDAYLPQSHTASFNSEGTKVVTPSQANTARLWDALSGRPLVTFSGHQGRVLFAAISPDDRHVATISQDQSIRVWDAESGESVCQIPWPADAGALPWSLTFSSDGRRLLTTSRQFGPQVWDVATAERVNPTHWYGSHALFNTDGSRVIAYSETSKVVDIYDVVSGQRVTTLQGHAGAIADVALSPDGRTLATTSVDQTLRLWDAETGQPMATLRGHQHRVNGVTFAPDGHSLVSASFDQTARIWSTRSGRQQASLLENAATGPQVLTSYDPQGKRLLVITQRSTRSTIFDTSTGAIVTTMRGQWNEPASSQEVVLSYEDNLVKVWNQASGQVQAVLPSYRGNYREARLSRDGQVALAVVDDGPCYVWHWKSGRRFELTGHKERVLTSSFSDDVETVATGSADGFARTWNAQTGELLAELAHGGRVVQVRFSSDGQRLLAVTDRNTAHLWDLESRQKISTFEAPGVRFNEARISPDGSRIVTFLSWRSDAVQAWDTASGQLLATLADLEGEVQAEFHPTGNQVVVASMNKGVLLWDLTTDQWRVISPLPSRCAVFTADGQRLATATRVRLENPESMPPGSESPPADTPAILIWNTATQDLLQTIPLPDAQASSLQFVNEGGRILVNKSSHGGTLFNAETNREVGRLDGHAGPITFTGYSPDGAQIVTTSWDHTASLWDAQTGQRIHLLSGHRAAVVHASFSQESIATASADGTCIIWNRQTGQALATLTGHSDQVWFVQFNPAGDRLLTISRDQSLRLWTLAGNEIDRRELKQGMFASAQFQPRGNGLLVVPSYRFLLRKTSAVSAMLEAQRHTEPAELAVRIYRNFDGSRFPDQYLALPHDVAPIMGWFSPDGKRVLTVDFDGTAFIWDAVTGQLLRTLRNETHPIRSARFDPTGKFILTGHWFAQYVYDSQTGKEIMTVRDEQELVLKSISPWPFPQPYQPFSPDGRWLVTTTLQGRVRKWPVDPLKEAHRHVTRALTDDEKKLFGLDADSAQ